MTEAEVLLAIEARRLLASGQAKSIRLAHGLSQADIGSVVGVSSWTVGLWECGKRDPTTAHGARLGRLLERLERAAA
jgi:DNA-binding transcriptional regulator YiaG